MAQSASAVPVFPSVPGVYIYDEATGDSTSVALSSLGVANFVGTVGDYSVSVTGLVISGGSAPVLDLDVAAAIATAGVGATKLDVYFSDGTFGPTFGAYTLVTLGPAAGGPATTSAYLDTAVFGQSTSLGGSADSYPNTLNAAGLMSSTSYYLTLEDSISATLVSMDSTLSVVPDGGATVMLLGAALAGAALLRKKFAA